ncbi:MAG: helix-turn-helix transcriptional regulator [Ruminococcaceae bacterium]|nr:helix-turn-helix transcriptional regulator [Oscillospiraceae bacterium]
MDDVQKFVKEMGRRIYMQRKKLGLTQEQVAELADISPQLLSTAENGIRNISSDKLYRISKALNVSADYLLSGKTTAVDDSNFLKTLEKATPEQRDAIETICEIILKL